MSTVLPNKTVTPSDGATSMQERLEAEEASRFLNDAPAIADAYARLIARRVAPSIEDRRCWSELAEDSVERAAGVRLLIDVQETDCPEPYPDALAMCEDIANGRFVVSRANCEHPLWTPAENVAFRIVHDVLGHYVASIAAARPGVGADLSIQPNRSQGQFVTADTVAGFDWPGEVAACAAHAPLLPSTGAREALFTECLAQTAYAIERGGFGPQVCGIVDGLPLQLEIDYCAFVCNA